MINYIIAALYSFRNRYDNPLGTAEQFFIQYPDSLILGFDRIR